MQSINDYAIIEDTTYKLEIYIGSELFNEYEYQDVIRIGQRTRTLARRKDLRIIEISKVKGNVVNGTILFRAILDEHTKESRRAKELRTQMKTQLADTAKEVSGIQDVEDLTKKDLIALIVASEVFYDVLNQIEKDSIDKG